jgi:hypothetical protein
MTLSTAGDLLLGYSSNNLQSGTFGQTIYGNTPGITLAGTEASARIWTIYENAGRLKIFDRNSSTDRLIINELGYVSVPTVYSATTSNAANVFVGSDGISLRSTSALKYKKDIRDLEDISLSSLRPVRYKSKCEGDDQTKDFIGFIADEADANGWKELVTYGADGEVEGFQYERVCALLWKKSQNLEARLAALESK